MLDVYNSMKIIFQISQIHLFRFKKVFLSLLRLKKRDGKAFGKNTVTVLTISLIKLFKVLQEKIQKITFVLRL